MARSRRKFTAEYRVDAARRVIDTGRTIAEVARDLGLGEQLLGKWVREERARDAARIADPVPEELSESERAELFRLRSRVRELDARVQSQGEDIDFLKKVSAYFAKEQPK